MDGSRSALIIASDTYRDPGLRRLRSPTSDAKVLAKVLRDPGIGGFQGRTLLNQPAHEVNLAVEEFFADRRPDDLLLLHFSCHGVKDEGGELYFATTNTRLRRLGATAVAADFVNRRMNRSRSRRVVLLLDCCYAGAFERGMTARAGTEVGIETQFGGRGRGRAVITASSAMEYAFEGDELSELSQLQEPRPSVFTSALVEGLQTGEADRDQDGLVGLDELYDYVYDRVRATTPNQTPCKWTFGVQGDLYIARRARPVTTPSPLPPELQQAIDSPLAAVRAAAVQELERLLQGAHPGLALAARQALQRLSQDDSRTVSDAATAALGSPVRRDTVTQRLQVEQPPLDGVVPQLPELDEGLTEAANGSRGLVTAALDDALRRFGEETLLQDPRRLGAILADLTGHPDADHRAEVAAIVTATTKVPRKMPGATAQSAAAAAVRVASPVELDEETARWAVCSVMARLPRRRFPIRWAIAVGGVLAVVGLAVIVPRLLLDGSPPPTTVSTNHVQKASGFRVDFVPGQEGAFRVDRHWRIKDNQLVATVKLTATEDTGAGSRHIEFVPSQAVSAGTVRFTPRPVLTEKSGTQGIFNVPLSKGASTTITVTAKLARSAPDRQTVESWARSWQRDIGGTLTPLESVPSGDFYSIVTVQ